VAADGVFASQRVKSSESSARFFSSIVHNCVEEVATRCRSLNADERTPAPSLAAKHPFCRGSELNPFLVINRIKRSRVAAHTADERMGGGGGGGGGVGGYEVGSVSRARFDCQTPAA